MLDGLVWLGRRGLETRWSQIHASQLRWGIHFMCMGSGEFEVGCQGSEDIQ